MMGDFAIGRYERKYVISATMAEALRGFVSAYLVPDPYMDLSQPWGYQVHSLYLDSADLKLYRQTTEGNKNRYKLRIRFYDPAPDSPAFLEIKQRDGITLYKYRAKVSKPSAERLLCGGALSAADLLARDDKSMRALDEFCGRQARLGAEGTAFVCYHREAYVLPHAEGTRVTFDRKIDGRPPNLGGGLSLPQSAATVTSHQVVLELKYMGRSPGWMRDLVRSFELERISFPKYVHAIDALRSAPAMAG